MTKRDRSPQQRAWLTQYHLAVENLDPTFDPTEAVWLKRGLPLVNANV